MTEPEDSPKLLSNPGARAARRAQLQDAHIAPLAAFVEELRGCWTTGLDPGLRSMGRRRPRPSPLSPRSTWFEGS